MAGAPIPDGVVLVRDGRIERVGPAAQVPVPKGYREVRAKVVTPGLVDAHTVVGVSGYLNQPHDQDQVERSAPMQPELRAVDAYNPEERLVEWIREFGVTTIHTGHGPGALISGQTMVVKTNADSAISAVLVPEAMVAVTLGQAGLGDQGRAPGTRAKAVAMLRAELLKAKDGPADKRPTRDLRLDTLARGAIHASVCGACSCRRGGDDVDAQEMKTEMLRLLSKTAVLASGVGLGLAALLVTVAGLLQ